MRGYAKDGVPEAVRAAGGEIYAVTSEPQALASRAEREWGFGFASIGDPHHEIVGAMRKRGWLDLFVQESLEFLDHSADWKPQHPKGYLQPGVLAVTSEGRVLYRWRSVPARRNAGGALVRPTGAHVWESVSRALADETQTNDAPFDEKPRLDARGIPWPLFVSLLVANGWFVEPRGFPILNDGTGPERRIRRALLRLLGFAGAWTAAFWTLPTLPVAAALALWAAWITPGIRHVHREFQNEASRPQSPR